MFFLIRSDLQGGGGEVCIPSPRPSYKGKIVVVLFFFEFSPDLEISSRKLEKKSQVFDIYISYFVFFLITSDLQGGGGEVCN